MKKLAFVSCILAAFAGGFIVYSLTLSSRSDRASLTQTADEGPSEPGLDLFFSHVGKPGIIHIYRSDCKDCAEQWSELTPLMGTLPVLLLSLDDSRASLAERMVAHNSKGFVPYYAPPSRVLALRAWMEARGCNFTGYLPFTAMTDGKGRCRASWQGVVEKSTLQAEINLLRESHLSDASGELSPH